MEQSNIIGWKEYAHFPEWGIYNLVAKADTGARSSAIDVKDIVEIAPSKVKFHVVLSRGNRGHAKEITANISSQTCVKSSNGQRQERYKVRTLLEIGNIKKQIEISLVCRKEMICRVLLGRRALEGDFLVDSSTMYLFGKSGRAEIR